MNIFLYSMMGLLVLVDIGFVVWLIKKSNESDELYRKSIREVIERKQ